jgi:polyhydroxybutyrate depolymerase
MRKLLFYCPALLVLAASFKLPAADNPTRREWTVEGVVRQALVCVPAKAKTEVTPVVFAFHGHGGSMQNAARMFAYHQQWPEALVIYMQGLNTPGRLTDPEGKRPGWQPNLGDQGDRDLKFFDAVLASLKEDYKVDEKRIFATGHSNGGGFTYLLWAARGDRFTAFAPSAAISAPNLVPRLKPKPLMHVAGENDPLVKFEWQKKMMEAVRRVNECGEGTSWAKECTLYASRAGAPVVTFIHPGTHAFPREAPALIVRFFKEQGH